MSLKLLLLSVDGTIGHDGSIRDDVARALAKLASDLAKAGVTTALWSNQSWYVNKTERLSDYFSKLAGIPVALHGVSSDGSPARRFGNSAAPILLKYGASKWETVLVGGMHEDMLAAVNNQFLLIRPDWYAQNIEYGFPVSNVSELERFIRVFALREHPIFWRVQSGDLDVSAAGPFSTQVTAYAEFGSSARSAAKAGVGRKDFWFYLAVASLYFSGLVHSTDIMCLFPGHDPGSPGAMRADLDEAFTHLAKCFRKAYYNDLIVRHVAAPKSQHTPRTRPPIPHADADAATQPSSA
jgi:hypothetical protein